MNCPRCQREAPADSAFCPKCGSKLSLACPQCGTATTPDDNFCRKCGHRLATAATPATARLVSPESYIPKHLAEKPPYDPQKANQLLAEAGYPNGFDAGDFVPIPPFFSVSEAAVNYLNAVGIRVKMRPMERAAFYAAWREKKLRGLFMVAVGNSGNAASRVAEFISSKGSYAYGGYPDIDDLFQQQASERDAARREALLHRIQQLTIDRVMFAPIMDLRGLIGIGPRVADHTINSIPMIPTVSHPDVRLKGQ